MRCVFAGTPQVAVPSLEALIASSHEVVAVVTRPDAARGRGRSVARSEVGACADAHGIPVLTPSTAREPGFAELLAELHPEVCPVVAYGSILPASILDVPVHGWVNLHFSLLPAWRGAAPVQHAIWHGDDITGASTFRIQAGLDDGPVFGTVAESVRADDTSGVLLDRLAHVGAGLLVATLDAIEAGRARPIEQLRDGVTLAPKISLEDARIRWGEPWIGVDRRIRAMTPAPGAWTMHGEERLRLGPIAHGADCPIGELAPGQVHVTKSTVWVGTATEPARLRDVQAPGKRPMAAADWARGLREPLTVLA